MSDLRPHAINSEGNFISGWYLDDPSLCDEIIKHFHAADERWPGGFTVNGERVIDKSLKDSIDVKSWPPDLLQKYYRAITPVVEAYKAQYPFCAAYGSWAIREELNIQYYPVGGGFHSWHSERVNGYPPVVSRVLVVMTYLNTVEVGGETVFYHQKTQVKPEKGLTLIWPADWTHTHRGAPATQEEKYIVTGWFSFLGDEP